MVYDITNAESFQKAKHWVSELQKNANGNIGIVGLAAFLLMLSRKLVKASLVLAGVQLSSWWATSRTSQSSGRSRRRRGGSMQRGATHMDLMVGPILSLCRSKYC